MIRKILFMSSLLLIISSCTSPQKLINDKTAERIFFGNYGGFTNSSVDYILIDNAMIFKSDKNDLTPVVKLNRQQTRSIQELVSKTGIEKLELNEPGNMTYYIRVVKPGLEKEIKWSGTSVNPDVTDLYNSLMSLLKQ
jgi:hypothetical protein